MLAAVEPAVEPLGDRALVVRVPGRDLLNDWRVMAGIAECVQAARREWIVDVVAAYETVTIVYDPMRLAGLFPEERLPYERAAAEVLQILAVESAQPAAEARLIDIPVCYGGIYGPDLRESAARSELSEEHFIERHASGSYIVTMIGFMPGFPYLTGLPPQLAQPRKAAPRSRVPAGSVGIAGSQTGVYPLESPGGWQLIGRTPLKLFDYRRESPSLLQAGDRVRFVPIDGKRMADLEGSR
ncbi:5-oxoprolinase subunit PxpB [Paenibacillus sp. sptzw28]|uniref:5-oxoprolinase subunit PxpB n=1 Tax=Paenibacillus sp. sptzw28 TaxID=715179 RepID=UPI001C6EEF4A|nr:5-oxoprolinase subunit PxpB [Paenibacillus sp. sptzw28]QYR22908.1 5-oxoprolinase subunit PxpB [Paenibacillus sp. sptzw28]